MFNRTHTPARTAVPPTHATSFAALFMGSLMLAMRGVMSHRMLRLASLALLAPLGLMGLMPAATFASTARPDESTSARVSASLAYNGGAALAPGSAFTYTITVTNDGPGVSEQTVASLPLDASVVVDDFSAASSNVFVANLLADRIDIQFNDLAPGTSSTATIMAHISADAPAAWTVNSQASIHWNDRYMNRTGESNAVEIMVGAGTPPASTSALSSDATGPVAAGTALNVSGSFYTAGETIGMWLNTPAGITIPAESLGQTDSTLTGKVVGLDAVGIADGSGMLTYILDTSGLPSGTYSLVGQGLTSETVGVVSFTIK